MLIGINRDIRGWRWRGGIRMRMRVKRLGHGPGRDHEIEWIEWRERGKRGR